MKHFQAVVVVAFLSAGASAQERDESRPAAAQMDSVLSGKSLGGRGAVFHGQLGWPGLSATLLTNAGDKLDIGGRLSLLYGYEGVVRMPGIPGLKLQGMARLQLLERGKINLGLRFSPGVFLYFFPGGGTEVGMPLQVDVAFGFALAPKLMLNLGVDVPAFVVFGPYGGLAIPVLLGGGIEYALDRQMAVSFNLRGGPGVPLTGSSYYQYWTGYWCLDNQGRVYRCGPYYSLTAPALEGLIGVSLKL